jgi:hypothetical protein
MKHLANTEAAHTRHPAYLSDHNRKLIDTAFSMHQDRDIISVIDAVTTHVARNLPGKGNETSVTVARALLAAYWNDEQAAYHW